MAENVLDIIMLTHNRLDITARAVKALYDHTASKFRVIVVDDSEDLTPAYLKSLGKENLKIIRPEAPLTSGNQGINIALKEIDSDIVAFCANSVIVEPGWDVAALQVMRGNPDVGIIGFKLLYETGIIEHAGIQISFDPPALMDIGRGQAGHRLSLVSEVPAIGLALSLFRKAIFPQGWDEDTYIGFGGYDDVDACLTIRQKGWRVLYCGLGVAYHLTRATSGDDKGAFAQRWAENHKRFFNRWQPYQGRLAGDAAPR